MARFEVHIPAAEPSGMNVTFRVDSDNWMAALKTGLARLGEEGFAANNVLVDVQEDNSLHVTESSSGRVFRIRELSEQEAARAEPKKPRTSPPTIPFPQSHEAAAKTLVSAPPVGFSPSPSAPVAPAFQPSTVRIERKPESGAAPLHAPAPVARAEDLRSLSEAPPSAQGIGVNSLSPAPSAAEVATHLLPTGLGRSASRHTPVPQVRGKNANSISAIVELEQPVAPVRGQIGRPRSGKTAKEQLEDVLEDVFERVNEVHQRRSAQEGLYFLLDLALAKIPAESGSAYFADAGSGDLTFAAVRGPKSNDLLKQNPTIPAGTGIVGFCSQEGVSVALSDVERDPRFYSAISEKLNYQTRSMLCSPIMTHGRAFGAMQLLNRQAGSSFSHHELGLLSYIAHQAALFLNQLG